MRELEGCCINLNCKRFQKAHCHVAKLRLQPHCDIHGMRSSSNPTRSSLCSRATLGWLVGDGEVGGTRIHTFTEFQPATNMRLQLNRIVRAPYHRLGPRISNLKYHCSSVNQTSSRQASAMTLQILCAG